MNEATAVNLFTVVRILILGAILFVLPLVTRKGLLFGAYVGEERVEEPGARGLVRRWYLGCAILMVLATVVGLGIGLAGHPMIGNVTSLGVLLVCMIGLYLWLHAAARKLAPPVTRRPAELAVASLETGWPRGSVTATIAVALCLLASLATVVYSGGRYQALPEVIPTHFGFSGEPDAWSEKSIVSVMLTPTLNLMFSPFLALMALLTAHAKRSVRAGTGGHSAEAQDAFRAAMANILSGTALLTCALMSVISVQSIRVAAGDAVSLGPAIWWVTVGMLVFIIGGLIRIVFKFGQGGARIEHGSGEAPLTNGLADNTRWVWGMFYVNRDDPSILVEKRFGIGYTINFGNRTAVWVLVGFLILTLGFAGVAWIAS